MWVPIKIFAGVKAPFFCLLPFALSTVEDDDFSRHTSVSFCDNCSFFEQLLRQHAQHQSVALLQMLERSGKMQGNQCGPRVHKNTVQAFEKTIQALIRPAQFGYLDPEKLQRVRRE